MTPPVERDRAALSLMAGAPARICRNGGSGDLMTRIAP
jgi:hypothetical protein